MTELPGLDRPADADAPPPPLVFVPSDGAGICDPETGVCEIPAR